MSDQPELLDEYGWPILENASSDDIAMAAKACGGNAMYGNFLRAALAGIYAEQAKRGETRPARGYELGVAVYGPDVLHRHPTVVLSAHGSELHVADPYDQLVDSFISVIARIIERSHG